MIFNFTMRTRYDRLKHFREYLEIYKQELENTETSKIDDISEQ